MNPTDSLRTSKQAREDTFTALLEAGALRGMLHHPLETLSDVDALYADVKTYGKDTLYIFRVPHEVSQRGSIAGATANLLITGMPDNVRGGVQFSFDGYADDPRELFQVPEVIEFCQGLLFGPDALKTLDRAFGQALLPFLSNEHEFFKRIGRKAYDAAGKLWVCGAAFPTHVYLRDPSSPSGWVRDVAAAEVIADWITQSG